MTHTEQTLWLITELKDIPKGSTDPAATTTASDAAPRVKPVRLVVELHPDEHRRLRRLADRYAEELGVPQVAMSEILRTLLDMVQNNERVATELGKQLAYSGGTRRR